MTPPNLQAQQRAFNEFREEFNHERPHEALNHETPGSIYERSPREYTGETSDQEYPNHFIVKCVTKSGDIRWKKRLLFVSTPLAGQLIGFEEVEDGVWDVYLDEFLIAKFDERDHDLVG